MTNRHEYDLVLSVAFHSLKSSCIYITKKLCAKVTLVELPSKKNIMLGSDFHLSPASDGWTDSTERNNENIQTLFVCTFYTLYLSLCSIIYLFIDCYAHVSLVLFYFHMISQIIL